MNYNRERFRKLSFRLTIKLFSIAVSSPEGSEPHSVPKISLIYELLNEQRVRY